MVNFLKFAIVRRDPEYKQNMKHNYNEIKIKFYKIFQGY